MVRNPKAKKVAAELNESRSFYLKVTPWGSLDCLQVHVNDMVINPHEHKMLTERGYIPYHVHGKSIVYKYVE